MAIKRGFTLMELAFVIVIISICVVLLTPVINKIRVKGKLVSCEENLENIGLGLKLYASEHNGKFPPNLSELIEGGYVAEEKVFDCPATPHIGDAQEPDYHYTTGYTTLSPSETAIIFDKEENHKGGKHVLCISGDIEWLDQ